MQDSADGGGRQPTEKWDVEGFALIGGVVGIVVGMFDEVMEATHDEVAKQDFFLQIVLEMVVAALVGAILFASVATLHNRKTRG